MWTMVIGGLVPAVAVLRNYLAGNIAEGRTAWVGIFANPNDLAYSLVILVPLAACLAVRAGWIARIALLGMIGLFAAGTFVTFSRGGLIGLAAVIALYALKQRNLMTWIVIAAMVAAGIYLGARFWTRSENFSDVRSDTTFQLRLATSEAGLAMFADHPILGVGAGCSVVAWPLYAPPGVRTRNALITHNTFIQALSETGILGFVTFFLFIGYGIWSAHKLSRKVRDSENGDRADDLAAGLEVALVGFAVCGLSAGIMITWFPYILVGMVSAARRIQVAS
jgi:O-antigen ligase